jgi:predicted metalloprotease
MGAGNPELDADRLAGAFLGALQRQGRMGSCDVVVAIRSALASGDVPLPITEPDHGTPEQRANAVLDGYMNGPMPFIRPLFPPNPKPVPGSGF